MEAEGQVGFLKREKDRGEAKIYFKDIYSKISYEKISLGFSHMKVI